MTDREIVLLDACSLIGLYATRLIEAILASRPSRLCIVDVVRREAGYVFKGGDDPDASERDPIDLRPLEEAGLITTITADSEDEFLTFIDLVQEMDEGEAMTGAIAIHRGFTVVTDDRKALRVLNENGVACETTLDLIKGWVDQENVSRELLKATLLNVRQRARYAPHRRHHLRVWWDQAILG